MVSDKLNEPDDGMDMAYIPEGIDFGCRFVGIETYLAVEHNGVHLFAEVGAFAVVRQFAHDANAIFIGIFTIFFTEVLFILATSDAGYEFLAGNKVRGIFDGDGYLVPPAFRLEALGEVSLRTGGVAYNQPTGKTRSQEVLCGLPELGHDPGSLVKNNHYGIIVIALKGGGFERNRIRFGGEAQGVPFLAYFVLKV